MCDGEDFHVSLANLLPVVEDTPSSNSDFPSSLSCVDSLFRWCCLRSHGTLCLPVGRRMLSLVSEDMLPFGALSVWLSLTIFASGIPVIRLLFSVGGAS